MIMVSIIIPCRNEEKFIRRCLDSFLVQDYPPSLYEIIVVDGKSEDGTSDIVRELINNNKKVNIRLVQNDRKITPVAFNLGVKHARGDILVIFSAHAYASRDYVSKAAENLKNRNVHFLSNHVVRITGNFISKVIEAVRGTKIGGGLSLRARKNESNQPIKASNLAKIYKKEIFDKIGFFDEELVKHQDNEFNNRILKAGFKGRYVSDLKHFYYPPSTLKKLFTQLFAYSLWFPKLFLKCPDTIKAKYFLPSVFMLFLFILGITAFFTSISLYLLLATICIYFTFILYNSISIAIKNKLSYFFAVPIVCFTIHVSVSLGFIAGVLKFIVFRRGKSVKSYQDDFRSA